MLAAVGKATEEAEINSYTHAESGRPQVATGDATIAKVQVTRRATDTSEKAKEKAGHKVVERPADLTSRSHGTLICRRSSATTAMRWVTLQGIVRSLTSVRSKQIWRRRKTTIRVFRWPKFVRSS